MSAFMGALMGAAALPGMIASGDFTNIATNNVADGVFTLFGVPCSIEDIIDLDHPANGFDPETNLDANGILIDGPPYDSPTMLIAEPLLSTLLANGFTFLAEIYLAGEASETFTLSMRDPTGDSSESYCYTDVNNGIDLTPISGDWISGGVGELVNEQINKVAITVLPLAGAVSINGNATRSAVNVMIDESVGAIAMQISGEAGIRFRSFAFYEPVADADLPGLSS